MPTIDELLGTLEVGRTGKIQVKPMMVSDATDGTKRYVNDYRPESGPITESAVYSLYEDHGDLGKHCYGCDFGCFIFHLNHLCLAEAAAERVNAEVSEVNNCCCSRLIWP